jgi:uncharacterized protein YndB with AHSA1/START domain
MPKVRRSRQVPVSPESVWQVLSDPHHQPRWWPDVRRVEDVREDGFTQVIYTRKGRPVRVDFLLGAVEPPARVVWEQELAGTPFERVLVAMEIEIRVEPRDGGSEVTIEQRQQLRGYSRTGGWMLRRATRRRLDEALDSLAAVL